jgi:predicted ATPase/class 3 adenylate cyclase
MPGHRGMAELPTGTVTFLFTDVESSTLLLEELGAEPYAEALAEHRRLLRDSVACYGGVEVDTQGDAFFVAFATADGALAAARDAQQALADGSLRVRMGLHTGKPVVTVEGYVGMDVHRGARIAGAGHGGQVLVSEATRLALRDGAELRDLGEQRLKDLGAPIRLYQLGDAEFPPLKVLYRATLPVQPSPLIGRERELDEAAALLHDARLLTLTGAGGSGKTRLALQLAAEASDDFPDGVFWVPLAAVTDPELVTPTIAEAIGAQDALSEHVGAKRMLLLLDNFEQVLAAAPELGDLLRGCPNLTLLITSRAVLRIAGEHEYQVDPLPLTDAVRLFAERARAIVPTFEPDAAVEEICRRLDGLPLAIELAAARVRIFEPEDLLARLDQRLPLLTGGARDAPERQRTLRAAIEWSYDLLDREEQRLFARLAVFAGSFDVAAVEAVCEAPFDLLETLVERSLVRRWESGRLGLLETIREFGLERLRDSGEQDAIAQAHLEYFLALAEAAEVQGEGYGAGWLDRLDAERDNFRAALRWGLDEGRPVLALRLASALGRFWVIRAHREGYGWLSEALEAARDAPPDVRAPALMWAGSTLFFTADYARSEALCEEALGLFRELGDDENVAAMLDRLAASRMVHDDFATARAMADESVALYRALGNRARTTYPLSKVAADECVRGNRDRGIALFEEALDLAREIGDSWWAGGLLLQLAWWVGEQGDRAKAVALLRESVVIGHELGNAPHLVNAFAGLATLAAADGHARRAGTLWGAVEALEATGEAMLDPGERAGYEEQLLAQPDADFEAGREAGRALTLDDAVAFALTDS